MSDLLELSKQYRQSGLACKERLCRLRDRLGAGRCGSAEEFELRREITMLTAMSRDCIAISNYLKDYHERRARHGQNAEEAGE